MIIQMWLAHVDVGLILFFGHNPKLVHVLNGGLKKWIKKIKKLQMK